MTDYLTYITCEHCEHRWLTESDMERPTCPSCQRKTDRVDPEEELLIRAKWTFDGAESIEEMADMMEERAQHIRELPNDGWELRDEVVDDYAHLYRECDT